MRMGHSKPKGIRDTSEGLQLWANHSRTRTPLRDCGLQVIHTGTIDTDQQTETITQTNSTSWLPITIPEVFVWTEHGKIYGKISAVRLGQGDTHVYVCV